MLDAFPQASLMAAFLAGLLSFLSPCVLPLVPSYLTYLTGLSIDQLTDRRAGERIRKTIVVNALLFIAGFSAVFISFGASASLMGQVLSDYQHVIRKVGGILIILFGLYLMGIIKPQLLMIEKRLHFTARPTGYIGSLLIGAAFAAGWTPCVGPVLGTVLLYAGTTDTLMDGIMLLTFYSLGLGLPLLITSLALDRFLVSFKELRAYLGMISGVSGVLMIIFGAILYMDRLALLTALFERYGIGSYFGADGA
jgi:cytochrome c-type biogenesis protein